MPRKKVPIIANCPYHINSRSVNGERFPLPLDTVWSIMSDYLYLMSIGFNISIHAFVLMSNHFHLLATPNEDSLSSGLLYFMRETSREMNKLSGRTNQTYGVRNYKTFLGNHHYFLNTYKYIYTNPVRANLCGRVEDYKYSTLYGIVGNGHLVIPVNDDVLSFENMEESLSWLNIMPELNAQEHMRLALRRPIFKFKADSKTEKLPRWERELI